LFYIKTIYFHPTRR